MIALLLSMFSANPNSIPVTTSIGYSPLIFLVSLTLFGHTHLDILLNSPIHELLAHSFASGLS